MIAKPSRVLQAIRNVVLLLEFNIEYRMEQLRARPIFTYQLVVNMITEKLSLKSMRIWRIRQKYLIWRKSKGISFWGEIVLKKGIKDRIRLEKIAAQGRLKKEK